MHTELIEVMRNQASAIYWAVTDSDVQQSERGASGAAPDTAVSPEAEAAGIEGVAAIRNAISEAQRLRAGANQGCSIPRTLQ